jgi:dTDP-4-amino-4,6-dideoxygalactose transaminase
VILFQKPQLPPIATIAAYYARSEEARWFSSRGPCHELLIERLEGYLGPGVSCVPVGNATAGLMLGLRALGRQGDAEVFSFHATKPFAIGEGGLLTTTRAEVAERAARLANFGLEDGVVHDAPGLNAKLAEWPAATALAVLDGFDDVLAGRRAAAAEILEALAPHGYTGQAAGEAAAWQFVPVLAPSPRVRAAALALARERDIELRAYFSVPLHRMPAYASVPVAGSLRRTEDLAARALSLPMANDQSAADRDAIVACLSVAARGAGRPVYGRARP